MSASLESVLVSVWQQSLIDRKKTVDLEGESFPVRQTSKSKLKQIDFLFEDRQMRGMEQNRNTKSRWAKLAQGRKTDYAIPRTRQIHRGRCGRESSHL
jgi:hypothetical protein